VRIIQKNAVDRIPSPPTTGMLTQHKNSLLKLLRGILTRVRIIHKSAVGRIPSPRTAGMMTQHQNSKKFSSKIVTRHFSHVCASEILLVTLFVNLGHLSNSATGTFFRFCQAALQKYLRISNS
jgi:hypothetical protein